MSLSWIAIQSLVETVGLQMDLIDLLESRITTLEEKVSMLVKISELQEELDKARSEQ